MPKVSVVMAAYNHEKFVGAAIDSVLMQSLEDVELCITDDRSPDGTADAINAVNDERVHLHRFEQNRGAAAALNDAIRRSNGEYIAVLNSDDIFLSDKLRMQAEFLDTHPEVGAVFGYPTFIDDGGNSIPPERTFYEKIFEVKNCDTAGWLRQFFFRGNCLCHPSVMIRKACHESVGLYDERFAQVHDFDLWLRLLPKYQIVLIPEPVMLFRIVSGEGNASAPRPEVTTRVLWEYEKTMRHFHDLDDKLFDNTFREEVDLRKIDRRLSRELKLGLMAMGASPIWVRRFGLDALFKAIPAQLESPESSFGISARQFINLTGDTDFYNFGRTSQAIAALNARIAELEGAHGPGKSAQAAPSDDSGWLSKLRRK